MPTLSIKQNTYLKPALDLGITLNREKPESPATPPDTTLTQVQPLLKIKEANFNLNQTPDTVTNIDQGKMLKKPEEAKFTLKQTSTTSSVLTQEQKQEKIKSLITKANSAPKKPSKILATSVKVAKAIAPYCETFLFGGAALTYIKKDAFFLSATGTPLITTPLAFNWTCSCVFGAVEAIATAVRAKSLVDNCKSLKSLNNIKNTFKSQLNVDKLPDNEAYKTLIKEKSELEIKEDTNKLSETEKLKLSNIREFELTKRLKGSTVKKTIQNSIATFTGIIKVAGRIAMGAPIPNAWGLGASIVIFSRILEFFTIALPNKFLNFFREKAAKEDNKNKIDILTEHIKKLKNDTTSSLFDASLIKSYTKYKSEIDNYNMDAINDIMNDSENKLSVEFKQKLENYLNKEAEPKRSKILKLFNIEKSPTIYDRRCKKDAEFIVSLIENLRPHYKDDVKELTGDKLNEIYDNETSYERLRSYVKAMGVSSKTINKHIKANNTYKKEITTDDLKYEELYNIKRTFKDTREKYIAELVEQMKKGVNPLWV